MEYQSIVELAPYATWARSPWSRHLLNWEALAVSAEDLKLYKPQATSSAQTLIRTIATWSRYFQNMSNRSPSPSPSMTVAVFTHATAPFYQGPPEISPMEPVAILLKPTLEWFLHQLQWASKNYWVKEPVNSQRECQHRSGVNGVTPAMMVPLKLADTWDATREASLKSTDLGHWRNSPSW